MIRSINTLFLSVVICSLALSGCSLDIKRPVPAKTTVVVSPEVLDSVNLAAATTSPSTHDGILLQAVQKAKTVDDLVFLASRCRGNVNSEAIINVGLTKVTTPAESIKLASVSTLRLRDSILKGGVRCATSLEEIIALARNCSSSSNHDEILLQGVRLASNSSDLLKLSNACFTGSYRNAILASKPCNIKRVEEKETTTPAATPTDSDLQKAYQEMLNAQQAYLKATSESASTDIVSALANDYRTKKSAYDALNK